ncbi:MAG: peptidoglycan-binding domain-containing protein [bacterium]
MKNISPRHSVELKEKRLIGNISGYNYEVTEIQDTLREMGIYSGEMDGLMSPKTREAIKEFQVLKELNPTGIIDSETILELDMEKIGRSTTENIDKEFVDQEFDVGEDAKMQKKQPDEVVKTNEKEIKNMYKVQDEVLASRLKSKKRIKQIQVALKKAGFYKGRVDGKIGVQTESAIKAFQEAKGLIVDGIVEQKTWDALNKYL